jgi:hypothetical protein
LAPRRCYTVASVRSPQSPCRHSTAGCGTHHRGLPRPGLGEVPRRVRRVAAPGRQWRWWRIGVRMMACGEGCSAAWTRGGGQGWSTWGEAASLMARAARGSWRIVSAAVKMRTRGKIQPRNAESARKRTLGGAAAVDGGRCGVLARMCPHLPSSRTPISACAAASGLSYALALPSRGSGERERRARRPSRSLRRSAPPSSRRRFFSGGEAAKGLSPA